MRYIRRSIENEIKRASGAFPAVLLTGPRRAGKTTLLKKLFPKAAYYLLEDPDLILRVKTDPRSFIEEIKPPAILDEIQNVPELFNYIRTLIDAKPGRRGLWYLTGSQDAPLMKGVSESMAGRIAVFHLMPLSRQETQKVSIMRGGFPEAISNPKASSVWFRSYIQTYLERDVRAVSAIKNLAVFRRFLALVASRSGTILNRTDLAGPLGISVPALSEWLSILEVTSQIIVVPPFYENFGKRLIKSPKIYLADSGLACHLLGIENEAMLRKSPFYGQIFEGFIASEIAKHQLNSGRQKQIYYFRDQQGLEVDFIVPSGGANIVIIEAKASRTVRPDMGRALNRLSQAVSRYKVKKYVVHLDSPKSSKRDFHTLSPGIKAIPASTVTSYLESRQKQA